MLFNELNVLSAVLWKILVLLNSSDICLPAWKCLIYRLCFLELWCCWEVCCNLTIDIIAYTYRDLIEISKYIKYCKCNVCCSLDTAAILWCHTVEPTHSSRSSCCCTKLTAITAAASELICLVAKYLTYKLACSYCAWVCLTYSDDLLDLVWRYTCTDGTVSCQSWRWCNHRVDSVIRILQWTKLTLKKDVLALLDRLIEVCWYVTYIRSNHLFILHECVEYIINL